MKMNTPPPNELGTPKPASTAKAEEHEYRERVVIDAAKKWRQSKSNIDAALLDMAVAELVLFETKA